MIRIVLDTNILVSAILSPQGKPAHILHLALDGMVRLVISQSIIQETQKVFRYPKMIRLLKRHGIRLEEIESFVQKLVKISVVTPGELILNGVQGDPADNMVLTCAVVGRADYIISGDHQLTDLKNYQGIDIVNPFIFLNLYGAIKL